MQRENRQNVQAETDKVRIKVIPTEVYSRVVGYYRPVQNWNKGKMEEFIERNLIDPESPAPSVN
ncbi:MAG: anaerobic ribonucleoside-triphosphate reductase [Acidobacteriota bacterium]|jgi:anaerobic ribonucleoside-triphosphate reductase|nr:anaerobic ribonucleoside-triphosphate reductase [Acidobacteriota bacterium]